MVYKNTLHASKMVLTQQQFLIGYNCNTDLSLFRSCKVNDVKVKREQVYFPECQTK